MPTSVSGALNGFTADGQPTNVSSALGNFRQNGQLDTSYINDSKLNATANGDYLTADSNPYIQGVAQKGADAAQAAINAQFGAAGRSNGSGLYAQLFGQGISDATNSVYAQNYANERQLQQSAQNTLLSGQQTARESALARQYGADSSVFGAENSAAEAARQRQLTASGSIFNAENSAAEAARQRQLTAAGTIFGAENNSAEAARQRQLAASTSQFGAENSATENALARQYSASEANLGRQTGALTSLLGANQTAYENSANRSLTANQSIFGAQNASAENAATLNGLGSKMRRQGCSVRSYKHRRKFLGCCPRSRRAIRLRSPRGSIRIRQRCFKPHAKRVCCRRCQRRSVRRTARRRRRRADWVTR
ncbi:MAG: hypothetical protein EOO80_11095 [Oxalobacteraceae bacterium]|nr:MAG: hypothetical protein EOO80_11095 [Oxalobacteraceae bacterium]